MRSKIHKATITEANPEYVGSITIDVELMKRVGLWQNERVLIASNTTGARLETYVIAGPPDSGRIGMNGPAAHTIGVGEEVVIMGFEMTEQPITPKVILVDADNRFLADLAEEAGSTVLA